MFFLKKRKKSFCVSQYLNDQLCSLEKLRYNWDGENGNPVKPILLVWTRKIFEELSTQIPEPNISVAKDGTLDFTWLWPNYIGLYCTLDIDRLETTVVMNHKAITTDISLKNEIDPINIIISHLRKFTFE